MQEDGVWIMDMQQHHVHHQKYWILNAQTECRCINIVYAQVIINTLVPVPDTVLAMVQYVMANTPNVTVLPTMYGVEVRVFVIVPLSIHVVERDIVREVEYHVEENIRVASARVIIVGMAVHVFIHTHILVQVGIVHQNRE